MSELTVGGLAITCIDSLKKAVLKNKNLKWIDGRSEFRYYGRRTGKCVAAIQLVGGMEGDTVISEQAPYRAEIGVIDNGDGTYRLGWDHAYDLLNNEMGINCEVIGEDYLRELGQAEAARLGYVYSEFRDENGELVINLDE